MNNTGTSELKILIDELISKGQKADERLWKLVIRKITDLARQESRKRRVFSECDIDDIVQNSVLNVMNNIEKLFEAYNIEAWLRHCVKCRVVEFIRRRSRRKETPLDLDSSNEDQLAYIEVIQSNPTQPTETILKEVLSEIRKLPKESRKIMRLYLCGFSYAEIGQETEKPVNSVGVLIYRIKSALQLRFKSTGAQHGQS